MARPVTTAVVFFFAVNLFALMLTGTGLAATMGVDASISEACPDNPTQEQINSNPNCSLQDTTDDVPTGPGTGSTLIGLYNIVGGFASDVYGYIFPAIGMLQRAGTPQPITNLLGTMFGLLIAIDVASFIRGYDL